MIITWHGYGAIKLTEGEVTIAINPHDKANPKMPKISPDILLLGKKGEIPETIKNVPFVIDKPGEYEVHDVFTYGIPMKGEEGEKQTGFVIEMEGVTVGYLGGVVQDELTAAQMEKFEGNDILIIPVGGGDDGLVVKQAIKIINQIEPRFIIPIQYATGGGGKEYDPLDAFLKEFGGKNETVDKLKVSKKELMSSETKIIIVTPS